MISPNYKLDGVCVALDGGLGNQLFQAAAGYALAKKNGAKLAFDLFPLNRSEGRRYDLAPFAHGASLISLRRPQSPQKLEVLIARWKGRSPTPKIRGYDGTVYVERQYHFNPEVLNLPVPCHLTGYFQSEKYFRSYADEVRSIFHPRHAASPASQRLADELGNL